jgi:hypothetical protein
MPSSKFHRACEKGDIEVAKQELLKEKKMSVDDVAHAFRRACAEGLLELAKWILEMSPSKSIIEHDCHEPLVIACRMRRVEVAEWLVTLKPFTYEVRLLESGKLKGIIRDTHLAFRHACLVGDIEAAQSLLQDHPRMAISKMELEEIFGVVCLKGFLELAKWLLSVKPKINVSADRDFALKSSIKHKQTHVVAWLTELKHK